ncbi:hypothetical protein J1N35_017612 [Gossypium stocksii]|uniref:UBC core domain-containing protein n=1 Tax=Gossypium stocksii TaxID=47602 RepID=A0A9D4A6A9_9ROSI|nr:hypothetical protein J1N35_017612 [Gossypium stocksii]
MMEMIFTCALGLTVHEGRIYQLKMFCDKDYPQKPPSGIEVQIAFKLAEGVYHAGHNNTAEEGDGKLVQPPKVPQFDTGKLVRGEFREYWETTLMENFYDRKYDIGVGN